MKNFNMVEWDKQKYTRKVVLFDNKKDKDLIEELNKQKAKNKSISEYIKKKMRG